MGSRRVRLGLALAVVVSGCGGSGPEAGVDADPAGDAGLSPGCSSDSSVPAWAEVEAPHRLLARCDEVTLRVEALADGVARLSYAAAGETAPGHSWAVLPPAPAPAVRIAGAPGGVELCAPSLVVSVEAGTCRVRVRDADGRLLVSDGDDGGWSAGPGAVSVRRHAPAGERFYGFGERTGPLDKRGQRMTFWNTDAYDTSLGGYRADADPLYVSIPFFVGLRDGVAYGVFTDNPHRLVMDMARARPDAYEITAHGGTIEQYVIAGPAMSEVVRRYTGLTGRAALPPRWALGYHQSRWGYGSAARVEEVARGFRERRIPADVMWLDIQHMDGFRSFTWDPEGFPDPEGLLARLGADGFQVVAMASPGIKVDPGWDVYDGGVAGEHFLLTPDGAIYEGPAWPGASAFPDFTRSATRAWWGAHIGGMTARGVRGVWIDVNEPTLLPESGGESTIPDDVVARGDGAPTTMAEVHNVYASLQARATWDGMVARAPGRRPFVLSRAGYSGIQRWAAIWTGDVVSSWEGLRLTMPMLLGLGLSGVPMVGSDVGGYSGNPTPELYARWMALGAISPLLRCHFTIGVPDQEPWSFGVEVADISRALVGERYQLLPYLYSLLAEAGASGAQLLRPMVYEFQDEPATHALDDQAMLGPHVLVAPVLEPGATTRTVYLPAGRWFELRSGAVYEGPATIEVGVTLAASPMFAREGAIVPRSAPTERAAAIPEGPLYLDVYPGPAPSELSLYEDAGDGFAHEGGAFRRVTYRLERAAEGARLRAAPAGGDLPAPARLLVVRARRVDRPPQGATLDGEALVERPSVAALTAAGSGWYYDEPDRAMLVALADRGVLDLRLHYAPALEAERPPVLLEVEVTLPASTPADAVIHIASDLDWDTHHPLDRVDATTARGHLLAPRGGWFEYKYTRGGWDTVEKHGDCGEMRNRYGFGAATAPRRDTVAAWADRCR
jgi:alpha-glucosidase